MQFQVVSLNTSDYRPLGEFPNEELANMYKNWLRSKYKASYGVRMKTKADALQAAERSVAYLKAIFEEQDNKEAVKACEVLLIETPLLRIDQVKKELEEEEPKEPQEIEPDLGDDEL